MVVEDFDIVRKPIKKGSEQQGMVGLEYQQGTVRGTHMVKPEVEVDGF